MPEPLAEYMSRAYRMEVVWDEDYWGATFPDLPGLVAAADTWAELEQKIVDAKESYFEAALASGKPIPEPMLSLDWVVQSEPHRSRSTRRRCCCEGEDLNGCPFHTVGHPHQPGCCDEPEEAHRHATEAEYDVLSPVIFDEYVNVGEDRYRVDARRHPRGAWVTITRIFHSDEHADWNAADAGAPGLCFDMPLDALRAALPLLQRVAELDPRLPPPRPATSGRPARGTYSGRYKVIGNVELSSEERAIAEAQVRQTDSEAS